MLFFSFIGGCVDEKRNKSIALLSRSLSRSIPFRQRFARLCLLRQVVFEVEKTKDGTKKAVKKEKRVELDQSGLNCLSLLSITSLSLFSLSHPPAARRGLVARGLPYHHQERLGESSLVVAWKSTRETRCDCRPRWRRRKKRERAQSREGEKKGKRKKLAFFLSEREKEHKAKTIIEPRPPSASSASTAETSLCIPSADLQDRI